MIDSEHRLIVWPADGVHGCMIHGMHTFMPSDQRVLDKLCWKSTNKAHVFTCVSRYLAFHFPFITERSMLAHLRAVPWRLDQDAFKAWRQGLTGYPLVDAGGWDFQRRLAGMYPGLGQAGHGAEAGAHRLPPGGRRWVELIKVEGGTAFGPGWMRAGQGRQLAVSNW